MLVYFTFFIKHIYVDILCVKNITTMFLRYISEQNKYPRLHGVYILLGEIQ